MITFVHTADVHFGMENYGRVDPETGIHSRLLDFAHAFNFCIDYTINNNCDFFLFCGDAYKTAHPSQTQQKLLLQALLRLHAAGIPVIIVVGNHDHPLSFGKANALDLFGDLPLDGFYVISKPSVITLTTKKGPINIVGIPWPTRNTIAMSDKYLASSSTQITEYISKAVAHIIAEKAGDLDPTIPAVLASHMTVSSGIFSGSEKRAIYGSDPVLMPSQLAISPFDYVALGHLHRYQNLNPHGYPAIVYSGSIERVDFGERKEEKGFCAVTIENKGKTSHTFIKTPTRPFIQLEITLTPGPTQTQQIIDVIKQRDITDAIVKIIYHVPAGKQDQVDLYAVQRACANAMYLVGVIPIRAIETRARRIGADAVSMDFKTLLYNYFSQKTDYKERADSLVEKALLLAQEQPDQE
jgi:exonuclease SbcD